MTLPKVVLYGSINVGKTSLLYRLKNEKYIDSLQPTIGISFCDFEKQIGNSIIRFNIWDTAGQERYKSVVPLYLRNVDIVLLCFNHTTNNQTIQEQLQTLREHLRDQVDRCKIFMVMTKCDESETILFDKQDYHIYMTSSKTGKGITELFDDIATTIYKKYISQQDIDGNLVKDSGDSIDIYYANEDFIDQQSNCWC